jgi:hypothetical protein
VRKTSVRDDNGKSTKGLKKYRSESLCHLFVVVQISGVHFNFCSNIGVEESIVNAPRLTDHGSAV